MRRAYLRLAGKVEWGTDVIMRGRRIFAQKCGFTVHKDDTMELEIKVGAP